MTQTKLRWALATALIFGLGISVLAITGCGKSSGVEGESSDSGVFSPLEKKAQKAALEAISHHWAKGPDGWTTARTSGSPYAPDHFLRQIKGEEVSSVQDSELSQADKLNGTEFRGVVLFKPVVCREAGDSGMALDGLGDPPANRQRGKWTVWMQYAPDAIQVHKEKGMWHVVADTWLLRGTIPGPAEYAYAGVK